MGATNQGMVAGDLVNTASRLQSVAPAGAVLVGEATSERRERGDPLRGGRPPGPQGQGRPGPRLARGARRGGARRRQPGRRPRRRPSSGARPSCAFSRTASTPPPGTAGRASSPSPDRPASARAASLASSPSTWTASIDTVYWHDGRSPAYGDGVTFWALGEMVRQRARLVESDDEATTRARIATMLETFVPDEAERRWIEPALLALLAIGEPPPGGRDALFTAWRTFFERIAADGPDRPRLRGPAVGRQRPHRLHRAPARMVGRPAALPRHAGAARDPRAPARLGRGAPGLPRPLPRPPARRGDARAPDRPRPGAAGDGRRDRSSPAPTASRCTRWRPSACSSPRAASRSATASTSRPARSTRWRCQRRSRRSSPPGSTPSSRPTGASSRTPASWASRSRPGRWPPSPGATRRTSRVACGRWPGASWSAWSPIRDRPSAATGRSARRSSGRSPTGRWRSATGDRVTSPRRASSRPAREPRWRARWPTTTSTPTGLRPRAPRARPSPDRPGSRCGRRPSGRRRSDPTSRRWPTWSRPSR